MLKKLTNIFKKSKSKEFKINNVISNIADIPLPTDRFFPSEEVIDYIIDNLFDMYPRGYNEKDIICVFNMNDLDKSLKNYIERYNIYK